MIRTTLSINTKPLDDLIEFADDFARMASEIGEEAYRSIEDDLIDELRYYPPPRPNQKYQRTYRLRDGWRVSFDRASDGFAIVIGNPTPYTKYVVGSLAQARATAAAFQAWMHKGRWVLAADTVEFWLEEFLSEYRERFTNELSQFGSSSTRRRGVTR